MLSLIETYLEKPAQRFELEARYGEGGLSRVAYKRLGQALTSAGFTKVDEVKLLRVSLPNGFRVELQGAVAINSYFHAEKVPSSASYVKKRCDKRVDSDYALRLSLSEEEKVDEAEVQRLRERWTNLPKQHRLIDRIRVAHPKYKHWAVDCTVVKADYNKVYRPSECSLDVAEAYEVEAEAVAPGTAPQLLQELKEISTLILGAMQNSRFPITKTRAAKVAEEYRVLAGLDTALPVALRFIAPNMVTLQLEHLYPNAPAVLSEEAESEEIVAENSVVSVLHDYTVTDKADGERKMLFVDSDGNLFFITPRMSFEFCNVVCPAMALTLLDGEFIVDKDYAAFDAYFVKGEDCRMLPLIGGKRSRLDLLRDAVKAIEAVGGLSVGVKTFYTDKDVHVACKKCLEAEREYAVDGLIFTPASKGVGVNAAGKPPPQRGYTWNQCLKWKTVQQTTIDFKVLVNETLADRCVVHLGIMFRGRKNWENPQTALLLQTTAQPQSATGVHPFVTEEDPYSHIAYVSVVNGNMVTSQGEVFYSGSIVEFSYDKDKADMWRWTPVRVRWDKDRPNGFETAHNNWKYLMSPVTSDMLVGASAAPKDDRYYKNDRTSMRHLRTFHGFVKSTLLAHAVQQLRATTAGINLMDFGVGQAGDLWRWRSLNLKFVFGIDLSAHNLTNKQSGACIRYLGTATPANHLRVLFAKADMCQDLFENLPTTTTKDLDALTVAGVFGKVSKDAVDAYPNLAAHHDTHFQLTTAMFSVHYAFKSNETLQRFAKNVAACTALGGYFLGTTWDGQKIFSLLQPLNKGDHLDVEGVTIQKMYSSKEFRSDRTHAAVGYAIEVGQSTFNSTVEYLVDFQALENAMQANGFKKVAWRGFDTYYKAYLEEKRPPLSTGEQSLSFLNETFLYQKIE